LEAQAPMQLQVKILERREYSFGPGSFGFSSEMRSKDLMPVTNVARRCRYLLMDGQ
jgi:hypothetical protein